MYVLIPTMAIIATTNFIVTENPTKLTDFE